jgi:hypothetical protein
MPFRPENTLIWQLLEASVWQWVGLVCAVVFLVWVVFYLRARFRNDENPRDVDHEMLIQIRDLHREGRLTETEFRSIKGRLMERLGDGTQVRGDAAHPAAAKDQMSTVESPHSQSVRTEANRES